MINGKTRIVGLLGWPVEHTLSPLIHNTAFQALGLDYVYVPLSVKPEELPQALAGLRAMGFAGVNVTVPHKVNIMPLLDGLDTSAELVGAVNTVVFGEYGAIGYNTDMDGFTNSLLAEKVTVEGASVAIIGAGGSARAVVSGLLSKGAVEVTIGARESVKASVFAASFNRQSVVGCGLDAPTFKEALGRADILVNCTPVGMHPHEDQEPPIDWPALNPRAVVADLIYNPPVTAFLARAAKAGHKTVGGAGMLVEQGALAFALWTGRPAPQEVMRQTLAEALKALR